MCFYQILHNNSIGHLLRTSRVSLRPPKVLEKKWNFMLFLCTFSRSICCVCRTLPENIDLYGINYTVTAIMLEKGLFPGLILPPPLSH